MQLTDAMTLADARVTDTGYLEARARTARTGVQLYTGDEMGRPDMETVRVYRPETSVFDRASLETFAGIPITLGHPPRMVTSETWKDDAVGEALDEVLRDGEWLRVGLRIKDAEAVKLVQDGMRELSVGYAARIEWADGVTPDGEPYDAIQRDIEANHIAIVPRARAGRGARIGDGDAGKDRAPWGASPLTIDRKDVNMADAIKTRTVLIDGLSVETTDAGAQALEKLQGVIADRDQALTDAQTAHEKAIAAKDAEIAKKDAEIEDLKAKQLDEAALDARVAARADLIGKAKAIAKDVNTVGLTDADIRKAVVVHKLGDAAVKGKSDAYIEARFDVLAEDAGKPDPVAASLASRKPATDAATAEAQAYQRYLDSFNPEQKEAN